MRRPGLRCANPIALKGQCFHAQPGERFAQFEELRMRRRRDGTRHLHISNGVSDIDQEQTIVYVCTWFVKRGRAAEVRFTMPTLSQTPPSSILGQLQTNG